MHPDYTPPEQPAPGITEEGRAAWTSADEALDRIADDARSIHEDAAWIEGGIDLEQVETAVQVILDNVDAIRRLLKE